MKTYSNHEFNFTIGYFQYTLQEFSKLEQLRRKQNCDLATVHMEMCGNYSFET